jgi:hypothetical protein
MRHWRRALCARLCGRCGHVIERGKPMLVIELPRLSHTKVRCDVCDGPAPPDLPALVEHQIPITPMAHIRTGVSALPFDYKLAAAGREPGEDDA